MISIIISNIATVNTIPIPIIVLFPSFTVLLYYCIIIPNHIQLSSEEGSGGNPFFGSKEWVSPQ